MIYSDLFIKNQYNEILVGAVLSYLDPKDLNSLQCSNKFIQGIVKKYFNLYNVEALKNVFSEINYLTPKQINSCKSLKNSFELVSATYQRSPSHGDVVAIVSSVDSAKSWSQLYSISLKVKRIVATVTDIRHLSLEEIMKDDYIALVDIQLMGMLELMFIGVMQDVAIRDSESFKILDEKIKILPDIGDSDRPSMFFYVTKTIFRMVIEGSLVQESSDPEFLNLLIAKFGEALICQVISDEIRGMMIGQESLKAFQKIKTLSEQLQISSAQQVKIQSLIKDKSALFTKILDKAQM